MYQRAVAVSTGGTWLSGHQERFRGRAILLPIPSENDVLMAWALGYPCICHGCIASVRKDFA